MLPSYCRDRAKNQLRGRTVLARVSSRVNKPLGRLLGLFACTAHSAHSLHSTHSLNTTGSLTHSLVDGPTDRWADRHSNVGLRVCDKKTDKPRSYIQLSFTRAHFRGLRKILLYSEELCLIANIEIDIESLMGH